jgi:spore germination cell wall hydrolase CwlJ-like protein
MTPAAELSERFMLALCVWREARGETERGQELVAQVILNRVRDLRWPDTVVGVVTQRWQFSAFNAGDPNALLFPSESDPSWDCCVNAADLILQTQKPITTANHYCVKDLCPPWFDELKVVATEGRHVFLSL